MKNILDCVTLAICFAIGWITEDYLNLARYLAKWVFP